MAISSSPIQSIPSNTYPGSGTDITFSVTAPTDGNFQAIVFHQPAVAAVVNSISQTGCTWVKADAGQALRDVEIWYAENVSGGGTTITVTNSGTSGLANAKGWYSEWSGVATSSSLDVHNHTSGSSSTPTTPSVTPAASTNELILVGATCAGGQTINSGPTAGFTGVTAGLIPFLQAYQVVPSTSGSYSCGWTMSASGNWDAVIATFKGSGAAGATFRIFYPDSSPFYSGQI